MHPLTHPRSLLCTPPPNPHPLFPRAFLFVRAPAAEAIVNQGKPLRRLEIKARSRTGMRHRPRSHVLLALKERPERVDATAARLATLARRAPRERKVYSFAG